MWTLVNAIRVLPFFRLLYVLCRLEKEQVCFFLVWAKNLCVVRETLEKWMSTKLTVYFIASSTVCLNKMLPIKLRRPQSPIHQQQKNAPSQTRPMKSKRKKTKTATTPSERIKCSVVAYVYCAIKFPNPCVNWVCYGDDDVEAKRRIHTSRLDSFSFWWGPSIFRL